MTDHICASISPSLL
ncbi:hypothetical protein VCHENC02_1211A, partial [Vibrio harveyi]